MKNLFKYAVVLLFASFISCISEGEERLDYYKNQNRSPELKGWWRQINDENNPNHPPHLNFTNYKLFFHYYNIHTNMYRETFSYWYNDTDRIFMLDAPSPTSEVNEDNFNYHLNDSKDTLTFYLSDPPYIYVKSQGL